MAGDVLQLTPDYRCVGLNGALNQEQARTVLLVPRHGTSWNSFLVQYRVLEKERRWRPVMLLGNEGATQYRAMCESMGIAAIVLEPGIESQDRGHFPRLDRAWRSAVAALPWLERLGRLAARDRIAHSLPVGLARLWLTRRALVQQRGALVRLLRYCRPAALLVPGDRELGPIPPLLGAAAHLGLPAIVSGPVFDNHEGTILMRADCPRFFCRLRDAAPLLNQFVAARYPDQVLRHGRRPLLFSPGWLTLALAAEGMVCERPWTAGGGLSTAVFVDSQKRANALASFDTPSRKISVIGRLELDALHDARTKRDQLRQSLRDEAGLEGDSPLCVLSVPSYAEQGLDSWSRQLTELEWCLRALKDAGLDVVGVLHPKSKMGDYESLAQRYAMHVTGRPTQDVLPAADILVCSNSSILEWASLCCVPAVNYDYVRYGYELLRIPGVVTVEDRQTFTKALQKLAGQPDERARLAAAARDNVDRTTFDGRSTERFLDALTALQGNEKRAPDASGARSIRRAAAI